jgi:hypothetical protein
MIALAQSGFFNDITCEEELIHLVDTAKDLERKTSNEDVVSPTMTVPSWAHYTGYFKNHDTPVFFNDTQFMYHGGGMAYKWGTSSHSRSDLIRCERLDTK